MSTSLIAATCASLLLGSPDTPPPMLSPAVLDPSLCLVGRADIAGRLEVSSPDVGVSRRFALARGHAFVGIDFAGMASARVLLAPIRSGGEVGYIGVAGESFVPRLLIAEARFTWKQGGFTIAGGLVDDPWTVHGNSAWGLRPVAPVLAEEKLFFARSDLGGSLAWTSPLSIATLKVAMLAGEGEALRERNNGKNLTGMLTLRPLGPSQTLDPDTLEISVLARDGSRGLGKARDHRGGLRVNGRVDSVRFGWEGIKAWGIDGDAEREPLAMSVWGSVQGVGPVPVVGYARLDLMNEGAPGDAETSSLTVRAGAGVLLPPNTKQKPLSLIVGWEGRRWGDAVAPLAGADALSESHTLVVQVGFLTDFAANLIPRRIRPATGGIEAPNPTPVPSPEDSEENTP